ncbi:MAG: DegV family protein [Dehalococcoidales bacterium]|nr:DegV family protein [Dehalococcoidales bacterium]
MTVKIVTDSSADLPAQLVQELGITVVPLYVRFGEKVYRDRVDISEDEFYQRLEHDPIHPSTIQPSPQDFANVYQKLSQEADGIVSIHISGKLSGTCNAALQGKEMIEKGCPIEVVDSQVLTMGLGLIDIVAAKMAKAGESLPSVVDEVKQTIPNVHLLGLLDTLKYLALGGRIGKAKALLGSVLNVKPVLTLKDGEVAPAGQVRSRSKGIDRLFDFVQSVPNIQDLAIIYNTTPNEAQTLAERIAPVFAKEQIIITRLGPMLGVHCGPGILFVALRQKKPID